MSNDKTTPPATQLAEIDRRIGDLNRSDAYSDSDRSAKLAELELERAAVLDKWALLVGAPKRSHVAHNRSAAGSARSESATCGTMLAVLLLVLGIIVGVNVNRRAVRQERITSTLSRLSTSVPNLRLFPARGTIDDEPIMFTRCAVESVEFTGSIRSPEVRLNIANHSRIATQPTVEVALYDIDGNTLGTCRPVEFLVHDFEAGGERNMPESFSPLHAEPVFYSVSQPIIQEDTGDEPGVPHGFESVLGHVHPNVDVYIQGSPTLQPVYVFTIIGSAKQDGEDVVLVRYPDGSVEPKSRAHIVHSGLYLVRQDAE